MAVFNENFITQVLYVVHLLAFKIYFPKRISFFL